MQPRAAKSPASELYFHHSNVRTLLHSCKTLFHLKQIHANLLKSSLHVNPSFAAALISLYSSFNSISAARSVFTALEGKGNIFLWNAMIKGYSGSRNTHEDALQMFGCMLSVCDDERNCCVEPNEFTFPYVLKSCDFVEEARQVHAHVCKSSLHLGDNVFVCAALIDAYERCGLVDMDARWVFDRMPHRDVVCWNTMICGYSKIGDFEMVLSLFKCMLEDNDAVPTSTTVVNVLCACGERGGIEQGRWIHRFVSGWSEINIFVQTALVTMYSRCGDVLAARQVFDCSPRKDLVLWSAMMSGYGINGCGHQALELFHLMKKESLTPDGITFVSLLSACSHSGLIKEGLDIFHSMKSLYGVDPKKEHYACIVDLLGRAGQLGEALNLIEAMPMAPGASLWGALLGACKLYGDVKLGEKAANELFEIEHDNGGNYVVLSNIYADARQLADAMRLRKEMRMHRIRKTPGCSCIEVGNRIHCFRVGGRTHHHTERIYETVRGLTLQAFDEGYICQSFLPIPVE